MCRLEPRSDFSALYHEAGGFMTFNSWKKKKKKKKKKEKEEEEEEVEVEEQNRKLMQP